MNHLSFEQESDRNPKRCFRKEEDLTAKPTKRRRGTREAQVDARIKKLKGDIQSLERVHTRLEIARTRLQEQEAALVVLGELAQNLHAQQQSLGQSMLQETGEILDSVYRLENAIQLQQQSQLLGSHHEIFNRVSLEDLKRLLLLQRLLPAEYNAVQSLFASPNVASPSVPLHSADMHPPVASKTNLHSLIASYLGHNSNPNVPRFTSSG